MSIRSHGLQVEQGETIMASAEPNRIIVTESCCQGCGVHVVLVHHETFPEMRVEALSAERAAGHLANRLEAILDSTPEPPRREAVLRALADAQAFLDREGAAHIARDI
jgi:hypothetical protein